MYAVGASSERQIDRWHAGIIRARRPSDKALLCTLRIRSRSCFEDLLYIDLTLHACAGRIGCVQKDHQRNTTYVPAVADLSAVAIPGELTELVELFAEHLHDVWADGRIRQGWRYGLYRDDSRREHPCLVPYAQLPEDEKEYDRSSARETLRLLIASGYTITRIKEEE